MASSNRAHFSSALGRLTGLITLALAGVCGCLAEDATADETSESEQALSVARGVHVEATSGNRWRLSFYAGPTAVATKFEGNLASISTPLISKDRLEANDEVTVVSTGNVHFVANVDAGYDAFEVEYPAGQKICVTLDDPSIPIYVGPEKTKLFGSFDLTTFQACSGASPKPVKWHPSHVLAMAPSMSRNSRQYNMMYSDIEAIRTAGGTVPMVSANADWLDLEHTNTPGVYDWSLLDTHMNLCKAKNVRFGIRFYLRTYRPDAHAVPPYMQSAAGTAYGGVPANGTGSSSNGEYLGVDGYTPKLWVPAVRARFVALLQAIASRYDSEPLFELFVNNETVMSKGSPSNGMTGGSPNAYDPQMNPTLVQGYFVGLQQAMIAAKAAFSTSVVIQEVNFPSSIFTMSPSMQSVFENHGIGTGPQDTYTDVSPNTTLATAYEHIRALAGKVPIYCNISVAGSMTHGYNHSTAPSTMSALLRYSVTNLGANYVSWHLPAVEGTGTGAKTYNEQILPMLKNAKGTPLNTSYPSTFPN